jgi:ribosome-associated protein
MILGNMSKLKKGYFVKGKFVAEGSELDLEFKRELKGGTDEKSRTELKRLELPEKLMEALAEYKRITNFEGRRRLLQFIGKRMRQLEPDTHEAIRRAVIEQHTPSVLETQTLHAAEQWRDRLITDDDALGQWVTACPATDVQQLRALIRQARKDAKPEKPGLAPRHGRAYRDIFQIVREHLTHPDSGHDHGASAGFNPGADA